MITIIFNGGYAILGLHSLSPLDCKETMPLAYHLCKNFYMRSLNSLSNNTKLRLRINACSMLCANAWMVSAWLTVLRKHDCQHQCHAHKKIEKHRKNNHQVIPTTKFLKVDCNDELVMLLHMTHSCKWVATAPTVPYLQKNTYKTLMWTSLHQFQSQ